LNRLFLLTIALGTGGLLNASTVIDCSGTAGAINSCVASKLPTFQTQLDWAILGQPFNGTIYNGLWTATNVLPSGMDVSVGGSGINPADEGIRLAYNLGTVFNTEWTLASNVLSAGSTHAGHFLATSNPAASLATIQADPTIHLMGLALNGLSATPQMLLDFSSGFDTLGFYGAAKSDTNFSLRVEVFAGSGGGGALLNDVTFNYPSGGAGGVCGTMLSAPNAPVGCDNAPFFYASNFAQGAKSVLISTTDKHGLYISNLYIGDSNVPEPASMFLCGIGLVALATARRKWLKAR
jgi:hypothetical protein